MKDPSIIFRDFKAASWLNFHEQHEVVTTDDMKTGAGVVEASSHMQFAFYWMTLLA